MEIEGLKERTIEMQQFCSAAPLCRFRCIQRIGQSMGSETSWSAVEYEEQFKEQNDFLKKQYLNQYRSNVNIRKTHVSSLQGERTRLMCASGSR